MPPQVLRTRYIDRKKLAALLNALYKKDEFSITVRCPQYRSYPADLDVVETGSLDYRYT